MGQNVNTEHINDTMNKNVSEKTSTATAEVARKIIGIDTLTAYIDADSFIANPYSLLGRVIQIRKVNGVCPQTLDDPNNRFEFTISPIPNVKIDETSKLKQPILRSSIIVDKQLSLSVSFLSYLSAQLDTNSFFSLMVYDQTAGLVNVQDNEWTSNLNKWKEENKDLFVDPEVCYLFLVHGIIQKNVIRKKYLKFKTGVKGGAYGVNINGELSTSTEEYALDIRFGLTPGILKRPDSTLGFAKTLSIEPSKLERQLFSTLTGATASDLAIER